MSVRTIMNPEPIDLNTPVSNRLFAKMVGAAESAVRKAVARKSIVAGKTTDGKIIPAIASVEWGKAILPEYAGKTTQAKPAPIRAVRPPKEKPKRAVKEKPLPVTADDWLHDDDGDLPSVTAEEVAAEPEEFNLNSSKIEADRRQAVYKAKMAELAYLERKGDMIPRSKLKVLFEYGANIRTSFEGLRQRLLDDILANAEDRQVAARLFDEEIHKTLTDLADPLRLNL